MYEKFFKRFFDIAISIAVFALAWPIFLAISLLVKIKLGSPAIFKQVRPGKNGKLFYIYKFRSMTDKKDASGKLLPDAQRETKFGNFLRKTSLDELPQFINILKGDMSLIGPRPRLTKDVVFYASLGSLAVRPGLTGRSQVYGRNDNSWHQVFEHDYTYAKKVTFIGDLKILLLTIPALLRTHQSEKRVNKYYGEELLQAGKVSTEQYSERVNWANMIERSFTERNEQILTRSLAFLVRYNTPIAPEEVRVALPIAS